MISPTHTDGIFLDAEGISMSIHGRDEKFNCTMRINEASTKEERELRLRQTFDTWLSYNIYDVKNGKVTRITNLTFNEYI